MLGFVTRFFVQDEQSKQLLHAVNINNVDVSGDTRFDRVWDNAAQPKSFTEINEFKNGQKVFIAGSTWPADEKLFAGLVKKYPDWKFIFAPHEIDEDKINNLISLLPASNTIRYSHLKTQDSGLRVQTLIIDNIGMLSSLYQYADIAYVGGGFGVGIHNTLEAAAFGLPVIFGPNYTKFKEARDLVALGAGFTITNEEQLQQTVKKLIEDNLFYIATTEKAKAYVKQHTGATDIIIKHLEFTPAG